jgi:hypothetical protein
MKIKSNIIGIIVLLSLAIVFHFCLLLKLIPYSIAWGGRLKNDQEMILFETVSIAVNLFLILILLMKGKYLKASWNEKGLDRMLWIFFFIFVLNTVGNLLARTYLERTFAGLTALLAILIWKVLKPKK